MALELALLLALSAGIAAAVLVQINVTRRSEPVVAQDPRVRLR